MAPETGEDHFYYVGKGYCDEVEEGKEYRGVKAVVVLDFGLDVTPTDGVFTVKMPLAGPNTALLCFA